MPLLAVALYSRFADPISHNTLLAVAFLGTLVPLTLFISQSLQKTRLDEVCTQVHQALQLNQEDEDHLVRPLQALVQHAPDATLNALLELSKRLSLRRKQMQTNINSVMHLLAEFSDTKQPVPDSFALDLPEEKDAILLLGAYNQFAKTILKTRKRAKEFARYLIELPLPVIVTDKQYRILSVNRAAEKLFGKTGKKLNKKLITTLFADPQELEDNESTLLAQLSAEEALVNLMCGRTEESATSVHNAQGEIFKVAIRAKFGHYHLFCFRALDPNVPLSPDKKTTWSINNLVHS